MKSFFYLERKLEAPIGLVVLPAVADVGYFIIILINENNSYKKVSYLERELEAAIGLVVLPAITHMGQVAQRAVAPLVQGADSGARTALGVQLYHRHA